MPSVKLRWKGPHLQQRRYTHFPLFKLGCMQSGGGIRHGGRREQAGAAACKAHEDTAGMGAQAQPGLCLLRLLHLCKPLHAQQAARSTGPQHVCAAATRRCADFVFPEPSQFLRICTQGFQTLCSLLLAFAVFSLPLCMLRCRSSMLSRC